MSRIFLDDRLLDKNWGIALADVRHVNAMLDLSIRRDGLSGDISAQHCIGQLKKAIHSFAAIYYSIREACRSSLITGLDSITQRAILSYYASVGATQTAFKDCEYGSKTLVRRSGKQDSSRTSQSEIHFHSEDKLVIHSAISSIGLEAESDLRRLMKKGSRCLEAITDQSHRFLVSDKGIRDKVIRDDSAILADLTIFSRDFIATFPVDCYAIDDNDNIGSINGKRGTLREMNKVLVKHQLNKVGADDIIGNVSTKGFLSNTICSLMFYDPIEARNPFEGFSSYVLLCGAPGTGKTMLARYAMTLADDIAKRSGKSLEIVELDFEDRWQCGPLENLRDQLNIISNSNQNYIIFMDEIDTRISSRENGVEGYRKDVVGEFLRFRGGGSYANRGNYVIIGTANQPGLIDRSLLDVFRIVEVEGPIDEKERLDILKKSLDYERNKRFLRICDWNEIGKALQDSMLTGREIHNVAIGALERYRSASSLFNAKDCLLRASEIERKVADILEKDGKDFCTYDDDILESIQAITRKRCFRERDYLK